MGLCRRQADAYAKSASENSFPSFSYSRPTDFTKCAILTAVPSCAAKNVALSAAKVSLGSLSPLEYRERLGISA